MINMHDKCRSNKLRTKLLERGHELTLDQLRTVANTMELSAKQTHSMEPPGAQSSSVNRVHHKNTTLVKGSSQGQHGTRSKVTTTDVIDAVRKDTMREINNVQTGNFSQIVTIKTSLETTTHIEVVVVLKVAVNDTVKVVVKVTVKVAVSRK